MACFPAAEGTHHRRSRDLAAHNHTEAGPLLPFGADPGMASSSGFVDCTVQRPHVGVPLRRAKNPFLHRYDLLVAAAVSSPAAIAQQFRQSGRGKVTEFIAALRPGMGTKERLKDTQFDPTPCHA